MGKCRGRGERGEALPTFQSRRKYRRSSPPALLRCCTDSRLTKTEASNNPLSLYGVTCTKQGMSRRRVAKHACDGCKIRKIKCTESSPCEGCLQAGIACTFVNYPKGRGPRKLRDSTLQEIQQAQQQWEETGLAATATAAQSLGSDASNAESLL